MKKLIIVCILVSIFLIPFMAFAADNTGVTDKEVTIGITLPMSGPAAFWGALGLGAKAERSTRRDSRTAPARVTSTLNAAVSVP